MTITYEQEIIKVAKFLDNITAGAFCGFQIYCTETISKEYGKDKDEVFHDLITAYIVERDTHTVSIDIDN